MPPCSVPVWVTLSKHLSKAVQGGSILGKFAKFAIYGVLTIYISLAVVHLANGFHFTEALRGPFLDARVTAGCLDDLDTVKLFINRKPVHGIDVAGHILPVVPEVCSRGGVTDPVSRGTSLTANADFVNLEQLERDYESDRQAVESSSIGQERVLVRGQVGCCRGSGRLYVAQVIRGHANLTFRGGSATEWADNQSYASRIEVECRFDGAREGKLFFDDCLPAGYVPEEPTPAPVPTATPQPMPTPPAPVPTATPQPTPTPPAPKLRTESIPYVGGAPLDSAEIEKWIIEFTNRERIAAGMSPSTHDLAISDISRQHSENMGKTGICAHEINGDGPTDRALAAGYGCGTWPGLSENIYMYHRVLMWLGTSPASYIPDAKEMAQTLVDGWMDSPGHKRNILDSDSRRMGVGVYVRVHTDRSRPDERVYATQNFSGCE